MTALTIRQLFRESEKFADSEVVVKGWFGINRGFNRFVFRRRPGEDYMGAGMTVWMD